MISLKAPKLVAASVMIMAKRGYTASSEAFASAARRVATQPLQLHPELEDASGNFARKKQPVEKFGPMDERASSVRSRLAGPAVTL